MLKNIKAANTLVIESHPEVAGYSFNSELHTTRECMFHKISKL